MEKKAPVAPQAKADEHVLDASGHMHLTDAPIDLSEYSFEAWIAFGFTIWTPGSCVTMKRHAGSRMRGGSLNGRRSCIAFVIMACISATFMKRWAGTAGSMPSRRVLTW